MATDKYGLEPIQADWLNSAAIARQAWPEDTDKEVGGWQTLQLTWGLSSGITTQ